MLPSISVAYATFRKDAISVAPSPAHVHTLGKHWLSHTRAHTLTLSQREQLTSYVWVHDPLEGAIRQPHGSAVCVEVQAQQLKKVRGCRYCCTLAASLELPEVLTLNVVDKRQAYLRLLCCCARGRGPDAPTSACPHTAPALGSTLASTPESRRSQPCSTAAAGAADHNRHGNSHVCAVHVCSGQVYRAVTLQLACQQAAGRKGYVTVRRQLT